MMLLVTVGLGLVGSDDCIKVFKKNKEGLAGSLDYGAGANRSYRWLCFIF